MSARVDAAGGVPAALPGAERRETTDTPPDAFAALLAALGQMPAAVPAPWLPVGAVPDGDAAAAAADVVVQAAPPLVAGALPGLPLPGLPLPGLPLPGLPLPGLPLPGLPLPGPPLPGLPPPGLDAAQPPALPATGAVVAPGPSAAAGTSPAPGGAGAVEPAAPPVAVAPAAPPGARPADAQDPATGLSAPVPAAPSTPATDGAVVPPAAPLSPAGPLGDRGLPTPAAPAGTPPQPSVARSAEPLPAPGAAAPPPTAEAALGPVPAEAALPRHEDVEAPEDAGGPVASAPPAAPTGAVPPAAAAPPPSATPVLDGLGAPGDGGAAEQLRPALSELARGLREEGGRASLLIRLDPPELGPVLVRLTVVDGRVDVALRAPEAAAAGGLSAAAADVQRVLAEHGLDLSSYDVAQGQLPGGGHGSDPSRRQGSPERSTEGRGGSAETPSDATGVRVTDDAAPAGGSPSGTWL